MPIPLIAAELAPTAIKLGANLFHKNKKTEYQKQLEGLADLYKEQAESPLDQNRIYQEGKRQLDRRDRSNRERVQNASAASGATDEARLASMNDNNEAYGAALSRLFNQAQDYRQHAQRQYLNTLGAEQNAKQVQQHKFQRKLSNIIQPLQGASNAFVMSKMFGSPGDGNGGLDESKGAAAYLDKGYQPAGNFLENDNIYSS